MVKKRMLKGGCALFFSLALLAGCAQVPQKLGGNHVITPPDVNSVVNQVGQYQGKTLRFGGKVVNVVNLPHKTQIEIALMPLDKTARPRLYRSYHGRIIVTTPHFIDPLVFLDHLVTVFGTVTGVSDGKIGAASYRYLQLRMQGYQIWHTEQHLVGTADCEYPNGLGCLDGWFDDGDPSDLTVEPEVTR